MRSCAKIGCPEQAVATVGIRYEERVVLVGPLVPELDRNLLDLCRSHVERLTPPYGWTRADVTVPPTSEVEQLTA